MRVKILFFNSIHAFYKSLLHDTHPITYNKVVNALLIDDLANDNMILSILFIGCGIKVTWDWLYLQNDKNKKAF